MTYLTKLFSSILVLASVASFGQITGNNPVTQGTTHTYTFDDGATHWAKNASVWFATGGTVLSESVSGTEYSVTIQWGSGTLGRVNFQQFFTSGPLGSGNQVIAYLEVTLDPPPPPAPPSIQIVSSNQCGSAVIRAPGTPPSGVEWFWITNYFNFLNGNDPGAVNASSDLTVTNSNTYHLASRYSGGGEWNYVTSSLYVAVHPFPGTPTASSSASVVCEGTNVTFTTNSNYNKWYTTATGGGPIHTGTTYNQVLNSNTTLYVQAFNEHGCTSSPRTAVFVSVDAQPVGGSVNGSTEKFGVASGALTLQGSSGTIVKWQYRTTGGWTDISNTSTTLNYINVQETTEYRAQVDNGVCDPVYSSVGTVTILDIPTVDLGVSQSLRPTQSTTLAASSGHSNYEWFRNNVSVQNSSNNELLVDYPGTYKVTVTSSGGATYTTGDAIIANQLEDVNQNVVTTYTYRVPVTNVDDPFLYTTAEQSIASQIYDGLGRAKQSVALQASPNENDLVSPVEYDSYGRQTKSYLPYVDTDLTKVNKANALNADYNLSDHRNYYVNVSTHATDKAFGETRFEASPLNRPLEQGAPGAAWQIGQNTMTYAYDIADSAEVLRFASETLLTDAMQVYGPGELYKNTTTDEDGNQTVEYTNKKGQTILKKSQIDVSVWAETYYIYDVEGMLSAVIPPEATSRLDTAFYGESNEAKETFLNTWAFLYTYDNRDRMITKKVPGAEKVLMVYDQWDRLVLTQDGNQRLNSQWLFTKYDKWNRPIMTGLMTGGTEAQERANVAAATTRFDSFLTSGINEYTNNAYPNSGIDNYLTVTYYDNYDWDNTGLTFTNPAGLTMDTLVRSQVTGTLTKTGNGAWIKSASYYDDRYRVIQTQSTNHLGGTDIVTNYYDFIGQVTSSVSSHNNGASTSTITRSFTYDHAGRLLETYHQLNDGPNVLLNRNAYNELGELIEKDLHINGSSFIRFDSLEFTEYHGNDLTPNNWNVEDYTVTLERGNTWKKYPLDYTIQSNTVLEFEYKSDHEGEIHGIGFDNDNSMATGATTADAYKLHGTQSLSLYGAYSYSVGSGWQKFVIPVGQNFSGQKAYITFFADDDVASDAEAIFRNVRLYEEGEEEQSLDYTYNIRGWLTSMNNSQLTMGSDTNRDLFGMELFYDSLIGSLSNSQLYNGNISAMKWSNYDAAEGVTNERAYKFGYDKLNRLDSANHYADNVSTNKFTVQGLNYDLNGNIKGLIRKGASGTDMDNLSYIYTKGNQLTRVTDAASDTTGFHDKYTGSIDYEYDANGNMVKDRNKGIDWIYYNHLNLPVLVDFETPGDSIKYLYDAAGIKLKQTVYDSGVLVKVTDYVGEFIYETDTSGVRGLQLIQHEDGRISPIAASGSEAVSLTDSVTIELDLSLNGNALDTSGNGRDGTVNGAAKTVGKEGIANTAYAFDGNDDYIDLSSHEAHFRTMDEGTLSIWFKTSSTGGSSIIGAGNSTTNRFGIGVGGNSTSLYTDESLSFIFQENGSLIYVGYVRNGANYYNDGKWHHVVFMVDQDSNEIYIDGVKQNPSYPYGSSNAGGHFLNVNSGEIGLGRRFYPNSPKYFNGSIDDVSVFDRALTEEEVRALYQGSKPVKGMAVATGHDYQYHLKDHLGNVRLTFSTTPENYTMVETFETGEKNGWQDLHRFTNTSANTTVGGNEVELLQSGQTGAMLFLEVNKGDTLDLSVNANYESAPSNNNFAGTAYGALFSSFDIVYGSGAENGVTTTSTVFDDALSGTDMSGKGTTSTAPRAFLNYIIFDKEMTYKTAGFQQISTAALGVGVHETISINDILPEHDGFILVYLSNENSEAVNIHWDDFTIYHGKTNIVSKQDYYPFGLTFNESVRVASVGQNFLYNQGFGNKTFQGEVGKTFRTERVLALGVDMTKYRTYDYVTGRFWQVDPLADIEINYRHSPYSYSFNNPVRYNDPLGDCVGGADCPQALKDIGQGFKNLWKGTKLSISNGLKALDNYVTGDEPDTRGEGDKTNLSGETLTKTEGSKGSQGVKGKPELEKDITLFTEAKGIGPAPGPSNGTEDLVKAVATEVSNVINIASASSGDNDQARSSTSSGDGESTTEVVRGNYINDSTRVDRVYQVSPNGAVRLMRRDTVPDKKYQKLIQSQN